MEEPLYPFFNDTDKPHMSTAWKNVHYTDLAGSITFDALPDTLLVGCDEEHLSRVRIYAWAVTAYNNITLEGYGSHSPVYTYDKYGRAQIIKLQSRKYTSDQLPRIMEMADMLDDTGMVTVYVLRVGIEPALALETPVDALEAGLFPNLQELVIPHPQKLKTHAVLRAALVHPNQGTRVILPLGKNHYQLEERASHVVFSVNENAWRLIPWIGSYTKLGSDFVRLEIWWEPKHDLMVDGDDMRGGS